MPRPFAVLVLVIVASPSAAQPPDPAALVRDLGSPSYAVRERAGRELWKLGRPARPALAAAAAGTDPEVRTRAAAILERFDWGIYPDTPADVVKRIQQFRAGDRDRQSRVVDELIRMDDRGLDALAAVLARDFPPNRRVPLFRHLTTQTRKAVPAALFDGRPDRAERLLEIVALGGDPDGWADYAVLMKLRNRMPAAADALTAHAADRTGPRAASAWATLGWVQVLSGRPADAVRVLTDTSSYDYDRSAFVASVREEAGQWKELAAEVNRNPGLTLFRLQKAGDTAAADALASRLTDNLRLSEQVHSAALNLLLNRRSQAGLDLLRRFPGFHPDLFADLLAIRGEFADALRLAAPTGDDSPRMFRARRGRLLAQTGSTAEADQLFAEVAAELRRIDEDNEWKAAGALVKAELQANRTDLATAHAAKFQDQLDRTDQGQGWSPSLFELLFEDDAEAARGWWTAIRKHGPKEPPAESMIRVRELLAGTASAERRAAAETAIDGWHEAVHRSDYPNPDARMRLALARAASARAVGDTDAAEQQLALASAAAGQAADDADDRGTGPKGWVFGTDERFRAYLDHGDLLFDQGKPKPAAAAYLDGWQRFPDNPILLYLSGRALLAAGDAAEGERRIEVSHWVPLGNSRMRGRFLEELCSRGRAADLRRARDLTRATVWYWERDRGNVWNQVARASDLLGDYPAAADATDRYVNFILRTPYVSFVEKGGYLSVPANVTAFTARARLAAGDPAAAVRLAGEHHAVLPASINLVSRLVPDLDAAGRTADADALFAAKWAVYRGLIAEYPASGWAKATAAELAAGCRRELDAALRLAREATELDPNSRAATAALAEVRFRRGERAEAVRLMAELAERNPRDRLYRRQLERYKTGDVASRWPIGPEG